MKSPFEHEIDGWLDSATRGIPQKQDWIRSELRAHYDDAVRDHLLRGVSPADAHQRAIASLGSADKTRRNLNETHNAPRQFRIAGAAALLFPLVLMAHFAGIALFGSGVNVVVCQLVFLTSSLAMLRAFETLLKLHHGILVTCQIGVVALGLSAMSLAPLFAAIVDRAAVSLGIVTMTASGTWGYDLLMKLRILGTVIMSVGLLWLAGLMLRIQSTQPDVKLLRTLTILLALNGLTTAAYSITSTLNMFTFGWFLLFAVLVTCTTANALFTYVFFRASVPTHSPRRLT